MWNPWNWVKGAWNAGFNSLKDLYQWVLNQIGIVYDYVNGLVNSVWDAIGGALTTAYNLANAIEQWSQSWFTWIIDFTRNEISRITSWVGGLWDSLWQWVKYLWNYAQYLASYLPNLVWGWVQDVYRWVIGNIWDPLWNRITGLITWVTAQLNYILMYLQHPELFGELIIRAFARLWLTYTRRFALPVMRWLIRTLTTFRGEVFDLIETVISSLI